MRRYLSGALQQVVPPAGACRRLLSTRQRRSVSSIVPCREAPLHPRSERRRLPQLAQQHRRCSTQAPRKADHIRNIGVIAHVDHGKTTLVDALLQQSGQIKDLGGTRVMDSNELEQERGITILAKNTCIKLPEHTINIVDTPGHSDFSGEVERALQMVEGFILLVDAAEGPKPGTRYVLKKSLELDLKPIVVINKVDRASLDNIEHTRDRIESLFLELAVNDSQLEYPVVYGSGKNGFMSLDPGVKEGTLQPLFDVILDTVPCPTEKQPDTLQAVVTSLEVNAKGKKDVTLRMFSGSLALKSEVEVCDYHEDLGKSMQFKVPQIMHFQGLERVPGETASFGDIVTIRGDVVDKLPIKIGHTLCLKNKPAPLYYKPLDEPTFQVTLHPNRSPVAGQDGKFFGGPDIRDRLTKEVLRNLAMKLEVKGPDEFVVHGRGILHLGILFEEMRREGFELELAKPSVRFQTIDGKKHEPWEKVTIRAPGDGADAVSSVMFNGNADQVSVNETEDDWVESVWNVPSRAMLGLPSRIRSAGGPMVEILQEFLEYRPFDDAFTTRRENGSLLSSGEGAVSADGLNTIAKHGTSFVQEKFKTYPGMIVGQRSGSGDLSVNITKATNTWGGGGRVPPFRLHSLESALEYIQDDELVEVTPTYIRMRKLPKAPGRK